MTLKIIDAKIKKLEEEFLLVEVKQAKLNHAIDLAEKLLSDLEIPARAKRSQDVTDDMKCRASEAKVLKIEDTYGNTLSKETRVYSSKDHTFTYRVGKTVKPRKPFDTSGKACASGIHFFMTREDAENY